MKILVTGGQGKVGRFVVQELVNSAHEVTVFDRVPGPERGAVRYLVGDIQDLGQVMEAMHGADAVIHLAAIHNPNIATATVTYQTNVIGTFNVHHAAFRLGIKRVVSASSNAIVGWSYGDNFVPDYLPVDEDHPLRPEDAYGLSKEIGETIARSYALKGLETVSLRPSGVVAPEELEAIKKTGGRKPSGFQAYSYIDARDLALAFRLAVVRPLPGTTTCLSSPMTAPSQNPCVNSIPASSQASATRQASSPGAGARMLMLVPKSYWAGNQCIPGVMIDQCLQIDAQTK